jgi:hypothetical protein
VRPPSRSTCSAAGRSTFSRYSLGRALLACGSLAITLLVLELATRAFTSVGPPLAARDPVVGKTYTPSYAGEVYVDECDCDVFLRFNREGFRGPDFPYQKTPGVRRLALIGDSMVAAVATPEQQTMARRLEDDLNAAAGPSGDRWEVMNFGVSGSSTAQELVLYRERVRRYHPDVVALGFFLRNDLVDNGQRLSTNPRIYFDLDARGHPVELPFSLERAEGSAWLNRHSRLYAWQKLMLGRIRGRWGRVDRAQLVYVADPEGDLEHAWELTSALLGVFRDEVEADGGRFVVVALASAEQVYDDVWDELRVRWGATGDRFDRDYPEHRLAATCRDAKIRLITTTPALRAAAPHASSKLDDESLFFQRIGHFNVRANDIAARVVAEGLLDGAPGDARARSQGDAPGR